MYNQNAKLHKPEIGRSGKKLGYIVSRNECTQCHRTERHNRAGKTDSGGQRYRYVDGMSLRRIAHHLDIHPGTVSLWDQAQAAQLPDLPMPNEVKYAEMDEFSPLSDDKKPNLQHPIIDRVTRCYLGFQVFWQSNQATIQELVDDVPKAKRYYSCAFDAYEVSQGKANIYSVEAGNASCAII